MKRSFVILSLLLPLIACEKIAVQTTPAKKANLKSTKLSIEAESQFWQTLHQGHYAEIPKAEALLLRAYLENPNNPKIAAHLGFLSIWKLTERQRMQVESPTIVNTSILAKKYFSDANDLSSNPIYLGFNGASILAEGKIFQDEQEQVRGYFALKRAIALWPEFNYFTAGYVMSTLPATSDKFKEALDWQWKTLDLCANRKIDRLNPDYSVALSASRAGKKRACWNSWIAPYNFQGFFMNMGDMLVKSGHWQIAIQIYQAAKLEKNYATWPFKAMLEKRIQNAKANVTYFQKDFKDPDKAILFNSGYGCMVCHQKQP